eukprot:TRINITY_DN649_c1_g1_i2.p1 TRINITY_DN649_c1_g1~~TRINITY_DN649_c1_g1_i2.p1  ORF type:complete len:553 (+),score=67.40 TRINITY_DN649_c1_g1_i2:38-1660(+)
MTDPSSTTSPIGRVGDSTTMATSASRVHTSDKNKTRVTTKNGVTVDVPLVKLEELVIGDELGRGVFGRVNKGLLRGTVVAVKELKEKHESYEQFLLEISIMSGLRHPNIVLLMGASFDPPLMVTEYLEGGDLHTLIEEYSNINKRSEAFPLHEASKIAQGVAQGMAWLHQSIPPIIHKDLKPKNIMLDASRKPKIIDFGLSEEQISKETENKKIAGSASWMAPEMLRGEKYNEKIDLFAYGIILWQLFSASITVYDTSKYDGMPSHQAFQKFVADISSGMRPRIGKRLRSMSPGVVETIQLCWAHDPNKRPSFKDIASEMPLYVLNDSHALDMWKMNFRDQVKVQLNQFYPALWDAVGKQMPSDENSLEGFQQKCLEAIVGTKKSIDIDRFSLLLHWYGPLRSSHTHLIEKLTDMIKLPYFHGELSSTEAVRELQSAGKNNRFLVRTSNHPTSPYVLSVVNSINKSQLDVKHYRILYDRDTDYTISLPNGNQLHHGSLPELIKAVKPVLGLKKPVKCTRYCQVTIEKYVQDSYYRPTTVT